MSERDGMPTPAEFAQDMLAEELPDYRPVTFAELVEGAWHYETKGELDIAPDADGTVADPALLALVTEMGRSAREYVDTTATEQYGRTYTTIIAGRVPDDEIATRVARALNLLWNGGAA